MLKIICLAIFCITLMLGWTGMNWLIPKVIMVKAMDGLAERGEGVNAMTLREPADPYKQFVVRPSPDLLYSTCVFDLSDGPLQIFVGENEGYLSISFFDELTNNFETITDAELRPNWPHIVLSQSNANVDQKNMTLVESPSEKGLVLIRRRISGADSLGRMQIAQLKDNCQSIN